MDGRTSPLLARTTRFDDLATTRVLLVGTDFDGTLAPIVDDPAQARPLAASMDALAGLAGLPDTHVVVISGRGLEDLSARAHFPPAVRLVGSHGAEFGADFASGLDRSQQRLLRYARAAVDFIATTTGGGLAIEHKPAGVALHYRRASQATSRRALAQFGRRLTPVTGLHTRYGKDVVEVAVLDVGKGTALDRVRSDVGATGTVFCGDDLTDEDAFARLDGADAGVKVGDGPTLAGRRVGGPTDLARLLQRLLHIRRRTVGAPG